ncbi:MAG: hypothetical protein RDV48_29895 [Candidatus Eremiobacteraeota bacterium]|nr:hypothetical protein [Candidatus Eremiobacteraeota bacterium]
MMGENRLQTISLRVPEETYEELKKYAAGHGKNVSDVVRGLIDGLLSGAPSPAPGQGAELAKEVRELGLIFKELDEREKKTERYVGKMAERLNEVQGGLNKIVSVVGPLMGGPAAFPRFPSPSWKVRGVEEEGGKIPEGGKRVGKLQKKAAALVKKRGKAVVKGVRKMS